MIALIFSSFISFYVGGTLGRYQRQKKLSPFVINPIGALAFIFCVLEAWYFTNSRRELFIAMCVGGLAFYIAEHVIAIGLTGGIATGKSTVSNRLREYGIPIIDADIIAREVVLPGRRAYNLIVKTFGTGILNPDQTIDRTKLGSIVFNDPSKRKLLNACTHKYILFDMFKKLLYYRIIQRRQLVVFDAPLLFETGILEHFCIPIVVVSCSKDIQLRNLLKRNEITEDEAMKRIQSQMPLEDKVKRASIIIENNGSLEDLYNTVDKHVKNWGNKFKAKNEITPLADIKQE